MAIGTAGMKLTVSSAGSLKFDPRIRASRIDALAPDRSNLPAEWELPPQEFSHMAKEDKMRPIRNSADAAEKHAILLHFAAVPVIRTPAPVHKRTVKRGWFARWRA